MSTPACRFCRAPLEHTFCDLGMAPLSNAYLAAGQLNVMEPFYPLHAYVCGGCFLVQLLEFQSPEKIFGDYAYFSSYSDSWLAHARSYAGQMTQRFGLGPDSQVVEIASNDGYLLQYFRERRIPVLGVEPAGNVAAAAEAKGIPTLVKFFGTQTAAGLAADGRHADLLIGNNVLAHVPDLNDFVAGLALLLKPSGVITMEFPHLLRLMEEVQFDTIYHEHFSYFSLTTAQRVFARHGLTIFDVDELPTHGGSLRIYACHSGNQRGDPRAVAGSVAKLRLREDSAGLGRIETYAGFAEGVRETKRALLEFLIGAKRQGKRLAGYGAAAKGNTLLNYCGIRGDFLDYVVDRNPHKQNRFMPGSHIPILPPEKIEETRPDYLLILPWNLQAEIVGQMAHIRRWGGRFVVPVPRVEVLP
jgi:SAM-dependent methyltransferase